MVYVSKEFKTRLLRELVHNFVRNDGFKLLLSDSLGIELHPLVSTEQRLVDIINEVITIAQREEWLFLLVAAAFFERPSVPEIRALFDELKSQLPADKKALYETNDKAVVDKRLEYIQHHHQIEEYRPPLVPFQGAKLPLDKYVERTAQLQQLKDSLLPQQHNAPPPTRLALMHGLPGVGKSVMAAAFAYDEAVRSFFSDGVLRVTLGRHDNIDSVSLLSTWGYALNDPTLKGSLYPSVDVGTGQLQSLLQDKRCLLIIDDVWDKKDVDPFLVGGENCLTLITSRRLDVAPQAMPIDLEVMDEKQALNLLSKWAGEIQPSDQADASWLADELGYLPLALELIGAQAQRLPWGEVKRRWSAQKLLAAQRGRAPTSKEDSVLISFEMSLEGLGETDRLPYLQLCVFGEDNLFPARAAEVLWGWDEYTTLDFLTELSGQALLSQQKAEGKVSYTYHDLLYEFMLSKLGEQQLKTTHIQLLDSYRIRCGGAWVKLSVDDYIHDRLLWHLENAGLSSEIHDLLKQETAEGKNAWFQVREALGQTAGYVADVRRALGLLQKTLTVFSTPAPPTPETPEKALLKKYRETEENVRELRRQYRAGQIGYDDLQTQLQTLTVLDNNQVWWMLGFETDAWYRYNNDRWEIGIPDIFKEATNINVPKEVQETVALQIQYILILASLNSRVQYVPIPLMEALVKAKIWTISQALLYMRQMPNLEQRTRAFVSLAGKLNGEEKSQLVDEAIALAERWKNEGLANEEDKQNTLFLSDELFSWMASQIIQMGLVNEGLALAKQIMQKNKQILTLTKSIPYLSPPKKVEVIEQIKRLWLPHNHEPVDPYVLLKIIIPLLQESEKQQLQIAIEKNLDNQDYPEQTIPYAVHLLAALTTGETALKYARTVANPYAHTHTLSRLVHYLSESDQSKVINEILESINGFPKETMHSLTQSFDYSVSEAEQERITKEEYDKHWYLGKHITWWCSVFLWHIAPYLSPALLSDAFKIVLESDDEEFKVGGVRSLIQEANDGKNAWIEKILSTFQEDKTRFKDKGVLAKGLITLLKHLPEAQRAAEVEFIIENIHLYNIENFYLDSLDSVYTKETPEITDLLTYGTHEQVRKLLERVRNVQRKYDYAGSRTVYSRGDSQTNLLAALAKDLPEALLREAVEIAQSINDIQVYIFSLSGLAPYLAESQLRTVLELLGPIEDGTFQSNVLGNINSHLPENLHDVALRMYRNTQDVFVRIGLAITFPEPKRTELLLELLAELKNMAFEDGQMRTSADLPSELRDHTPFAGMSDAELDELLDAQRIMRACLFVSKLTEPMKSELLVQIINALYVLSSRRLKFVDVEFVDDEIIRILAPELSGPYFTHGLEISFRIQDVYRRVMALCHLMPFAPEEYQSSMGWQILTMTFQFDETKRDPFDAQEKREEVAARMLPYLVKIGKNSMNRFRSPLVIGLTSYFSSTARALEYFNMLTYEDARLVALDALAPQLSPELFDRAYELAQSLSNMNRASALTKLAKYAPLNQKERFLSEAYKLILFNMSTNHYSWRETASVIIKELSDLGDVDLRQKWSETVSVLVELPRPTLLNRLPIFAPLIAKVGDVHAIQESFRSIQDVVRWWP